MINFRAPKNWIGIVALLIAVAVIALNFNPAALVGSQQKKNDDLVAEKRLILHW